MSLASDELNCDIIFANFLKYISITLLLTFSALLFSLPRSPELNFPMWQKTYAQHNFVIFVSVIN